MEGLRSLPHQVQTWITYAHKELSIDEIQKAIATQPGLSSLKPEYGFDDPEEMVAVCAGLVVIDAERKVVHWHTTRLRRIWNKLGTTGSQEEKS